MKLMKRLIIIVTLFELYSVNVPAQTFSTHFSIDSLPTLAFALEEKNNFIYVAGVTTDLNINGSLISFLAKFNTAGQMLSKAIIHPLGYLHYVATRENAMITTIDGGFAGVGYASDTSSKIFLSFTKFDTNGNLEFYKVIEPPVSGYKTIFPYRVLQYNGSYYIVGEMALANNHVKLFLVKLDGAGNFKYIKLNYFIPLESGARGISMLTNGNLLISSYSRSDANVNYWQSKQNTCFLEVDTNGTQKKLFCTTDSNTRVEYNVRTTSDGNYLSCGGYYAYRMQGYRDPFQQEIIKWDTAFNKVWDRKIGNPYIYNSFNDFEITTNGEIVVCGQYVSDTGIYLGFNGTLCKIDNSGNVLWYKAYQITPVPASEHYLYDVDLLPNGDIVAAGYWQYNSSLNNPFEAAQLGWLIRVNADGCMDDGYCGLTDIEEAEHSNSMKDVKPIQISPNPSSGIFVINTFIDLPAATTISVHDLSGKLIINQPLYAKANLLNLNHLPNGIYLYNIGNGIINVDAGKLIIQK